MSEASSLQQPKLFPTFGCVGVSEEFVVEYQQELVKNVLITLDVVDESSQTLVHRVPANEIGPAVIKVKFPVFTNPGKYTVVTKFSHQENKHFPKFQLHILSPLEVICQQSQMGAGQDKAPVLAAALAYLVQCDVAGKNDTSAEVVDDALVDVLQSVSKVPVLSLPGFLCAKYYGGHESFLHFAIRHRLDSTAQFLLGPRVGGGLKGLLDMQGYDKKTPRELAKQTGMDNVTATIRNLSINDPTYEGSPRGSPKVPSKSKQGTQVKKGMKDYADAFKSRGSRVMVASKKQFGRLRTAMTKSHSVKSADEDDHEDLNASVPEAKDKTPSIAELKQNCLFVCEAVVSYECQTEEYGKAVVKAGEIVYLLNEEESGMCLVIIRNALKSFPISCLTKYTEDKARKHLQSIQDQNRDSIELDEYEDMEEFLGSKTPTYLQVIGDDQAMIPQRIDYYAQTSLAEAQQYSKQEERDQKRMSKLPPKTTQKQTSVGIDDEYYVEDFSARPLTSLPKLPAKDDDDDVYEVFSPTIEANLPPPSPARPCHSTLIEADTSSISPSSNNPPSPAPPAVPLRKSSSFNRSSSNTPISSTTNSPIPSPLHGQPPDMLPPRTTSIRPQSAIYSPQSSPFRQSSLVEPSSVSTDVNTSPTPPSPSQSKTPPLPHSATKPAISPKPHTSPISSSKPSLPRKPKPPPKPSDT